MVTKYFDVPFANSGDKTSIPDASQPSGDVSFEDGWTPDYAKDQATDPNAKDIPRQSENYFKFTVTEALKEIQENGFKPYSALVNYPVGAFTPGSDNVLYKCLVKNGPDPTFLPVVDPVGDVTNTWENPGIVEPTAADALKSLQVNAAGTAYELAGPMTAFKNKLINGNFDIAQRSVSAIGITTNFTYNSLDRWSQWTNATSPVYNLTQESFTPGQTDVPGEPEFFYRAELDSSNVDGSIIDVLQKIENVRTLAGKNATVSAYIRTNIVDALLSFVLAQAFGSGGSGTVSNSIGSVAISSSWQKIVQSIPIASISGKTIGVDNNLQLSLRLIRESAAIIADGTYLDIAIMQVEAGEVATSPEVRPPQIEQALCERYYEYVNWGSRNTDTPNGQSIGYTRAFHTQKRAVPTLTISNLAGGTISDQTSYIDSVYLQMLLTGGSGVTVSAEVAAESEL